MFNDRVYFLIDYELELQSYRPASRFVWVLVAANKHHED